MFIAIKIAFASIVQAFQELFKNKLRSTLSLLGITIGILCIISVRTAIDSLQMNIKQSIQSLGNDVVYVQKWPWIFADGYPWWRFYKRPIVDHKELKIVQEKSKLSAASAILVFVENKTITYEAAAAEDVTAVGASHDYNKIKDLDFTEGRYFTLHESHRGANSVILGASVAELLFPDIESITGRTIKMMGRRLNVVGVLKKEGDDIIGFSLDDDIIVPYNYVRTFISVRRRGGSGDPLIAVRAAQDVPLEELKYELKGIMRGIRRLRPTEDDNFALNQVSILSRGLDQFFGMMNQAGWFIGIFAILVGGFGIANIMFVSVKERTKLIGIKKALGAKNFYILLEFLIEAVVLCVIGGALGLLVVFLLFQGLEEFLLRTQDMEFKFTLTMDNINRGLILSITAGVISGIIPAIVASRMKPVDAIRSS